MEESLTHVNSTVMGIGKAPCIVAEESAMATVKERKRSYSNKYGKREGDGGARRRQKSLSISPSAKNLRIVFNFFYRRP
jgi:hypothetical protein